MSHVQSKCKADAKCTKCWENQHTQHTQEFTTPSEQPAVYANCGGGHCANYRGGPDFPKPRPTLDARLERSHSPTHLGAHHHSIPNNESHRKHRQVTSINHDSVNSTSDDCRRPYRENHTSKVPNHCPLVLRYGHCLHVHPKLNTRFPVIAATHRYIRKPRPQANKHPQNLTNPRVQLKH